MPSTKKPIGTAARRLPRKRNNLPRDPQAFQIKRATKGDLTIVRALFLEYEHSIQTNLCFQNFKQELAGLPGPYAPPGGILLIAWQGASPAGCVALRKVEAGVCEMKRLFVRPQYQGRGLGRSLVGAIISGASSLGYREMRLDTLPKLKTAIAIYESLGFVRIPPYHNYPNKKIIFMALQVR